MTTVPVTDNLIANYVGGEGYTTLSGNTITQWNDQSPNGYHATQATGYIAPVARPTAAGEAVFFNGSSWMNFPSAMNIDNQDCSIFVVAQFEDFNSSSSQILLRFNGGGNINFFLFNDTDSHYLRFKNIASDLKVGTNVLTYSAIGNPTNCVLGLGKEFATLAAPNQATSDAGGYIGTLDEASNFYNGSIYEIIVYNTPLSDADKTKVLGYLENKWGSTSRTENLFVITEGDSLTRGNSDGGYDWPTQLGRLYNTDPKILNVAVGGDVVTQMETDGVTNVDDEMDNNLAYSNRIAVLWGGTNDVGLPDPSVATIISAIDNWHADRQAAGIPTIAMTLIPRADNDTADNVQKEEVNNHILNGATNATIVIDLNEHPELQDFTDTTYFATDQVHLTRKGYAIVAARVKAAIDDYFANRFDAIDRWPTAFSVYFDDAADHPMMSIDASTITISNDNETYTISDYVGRSLTDIISELNGNLSEFNIVANVSLGAELITASSLLTDGIARLDIPDSPLIAKYTGHIVRAKERSVIQLKAPRPKSVFESWYPRIGRGTFRTRFSDVNFQNYPGINPNAIYQFGIKEFDKQEWSPQYSAPFKDVQGEIPEVVSYHPTVQASVLKVSRTPLLWKNNNISITIKGIRQPNSSIKHVDENNGLIYINQKIGAKAEPTVDYTFHEQDYVYDAVDLNASIAHNPLVVDTYVAFYLKPCAAEGALISGGNSIFHEITTTEAAARTRTARLIPETIGTDNPLYEPVIYLGSLNVRQGSFYDDFEIIDTRSRGGGLFEDDTDSTTKEWRESEYFFDIGNVDGIPVPGNAGVVITLPTGNYTNMMPADEIIDRATKDVAMGVVPIVDYFQNTTSDYTDSLVFGDSELSVSLASVSPTITLGRLIKTGNGYNRDFFSTDMFRFKLEPAGLLDSVSAVHLYDEYSLLPIYGDIDAPFDVGPEDFGRHEVRNYGDRIQVKYEGLTVGSDYFPSWTATVYGAVVNGVSRWSIENNPQDQDVYRVRGVEFPRFHANRVSDSSSITFIPNRGGIVAVDAHNNQRTGYTTTAPGVGFEQWCDYSPLSPESGQLSWRTEDTGFRLKAYKNIPSSTGIGIHSVAHCLNLNEERSAYYSPFETVIDVKSGTWYDSIDDYRSWLESTKLYTIPKICEPHKENYMYPSYMEDVSFKAQYQPSAITFHPFLEGTGDFDNWNIMALDAIRLKDYLQPNTGHFIVRTDGYHFNEFDTSWPDMTPIDSTYSGALNLMRTGMTGVTTCPYSNFFYFPNTTGASPYSGQYGRNRDQSDIVANGLIAGAINYSIQKKHLRLAMVQPWIDLMNSENCDGLYSDLWGGLTPYGDYSNILSDEKRGNYEDLAQSAVTVHSDLMNIRYQERGDWPFIFTENIGPDFVGVDAMMLHKDYPGGEQVMGSLFAGGNAYMVPAWNTLYGQYSMVSQTTPSLGSITNQGASEAVLKYQEWNLHYGKLPSCSTSWTGVAQIEISVPVDPNSPDGLWIPANWDFAKLMIDQHYYMAKYCYHGRRLRPVDHNAEITASATVGYVAGANSIWQGEEHVGLINSWGLTGAGSADISFPTVNYPELANKTGFYEVTSGANTFISTYVHSGTFSYTVPDYDHFGVRVFEFRG